MSVVDPESQTTYIDYWLTPSTYPQRTFFWKLGDVVELEDEQHERLLVHLLSECDGIVEGRLLTATTRGQEYTFRSLINCEEKHICSVVSRH